MQIRPDIDQNSIFGRNHINYRKIAAACIIIQNHYPAVATVVVISLSFLFPDFLELNIGSKRMGKILMLMNYRWLGANINLARPVFSNI